MLFGLLFAADVVSAVPALGLQVRSAPLVFDAGADDSWHGTLRAEVFVGPDDQAPRSEEAVREVVGTYKVEELQVFEREGAWVASWLSGGRRRVRRWPKTKAMICSIAIPEVPGAAAWAEELCSQVKPMFLDREGFAVGSGYGVPLFTGVLYSEEVMGKTLFTLNGSMAVRPRQKDDLETREQLFAEALHPHEEVAYEALPDGWIVMTHLNGDYWVYARRDIGGKPLVCGAHSVDTRAHADFAWAACKSLSTL